jgi:hypothetical protein
MGENENETEDTTPGRKVSRRAFLASGAALGGVVVWGAAGSPASADAPPIGGGPPAILNTAPLYPPIIPGVTGATGAPIIFVAPATNAPPDANTPNPNAPQGDPPPYDPDGSRGSGGSSGGSGGGSGFFKFRFRAPNPF